MNECGSDASLAPAFGTDRREIWSIPVTGQMSEQSSVGEIVSSQRVSVARLRSTPA